MITTEKLKAWLDRDNDLIKEWEENKRKELIKPALDEVDSFMKTFPDAENYRSQMANIIESASAFSLKDAYELAKLKQSQPRAESSAP